jgi:hypothetical protein
MGSIPDIYNSQNGAYCMMIRKAINWKSYVKSADWVLLIFLLLFFNVKLVVKLVAVLFVFAMRFNTKTGFSLRHTRLPLFYPAVIIIAIINWVAYGLFTSSHYNMALLSGIGSWLLCILACHQVKLSTERNEPAVVHRTLFLFFMINMAVSLLMYLLLVVKTGAVNLYLYQGEFQKYFISTGDYIMGISFDTSSTNAVINAMGVVYFLNRRQYIPVLLCMVILLLTGSNMLNLLLAVTFVPVFLFASNRNQKSMIAVCLLLLLVFLLKVSPQNNRYLAETYQQVFDPSHPLASQWIIKKDTPVVLKPDSMLNAAQRRQKTAQLYIDSITMMMDTAQLSKKKPANNQLVNAGGRIDIPAANIHSAPYQHKEDTGWQKTLLQQYISDNSAVLVLANKHGTIISKWPGKLLALQQTAQFFREHPFKIFTGAGTGNFSSKLAFRVSALKIAGGYPSSFAYVNPAFQRNHLDLYLHYFAGYDDRHSVINSPHSVYDQLWAEYGLAGLAVFIMCYLWFFARHRKKLTYAIPVLVIMAGVFAMDYWFEQLSIVVLFELLLFLNIKETAPLHEHD